MKGRADQIQRVSHPPEAFEVPTNFHISTILKKKKKQKPKKKKKNFLNPKKYLNAKSE